MVIFRVILTDLNKKEKFSLEKNYKYERRVTGAILKYM